MQMTGHKTRSVFQHYNIVSDGDLREAAAKLDEAMDIVPGIVQPIAATGEDVISDSAEKKLEAPPGFEPGMEVLQTSALPLGYGAARTCADRRHDLAGRTGRCGGTHWRKEVGAGNGIRTRDFDLGKVALYH